MSKTTLIWALALGAAFELSLSPARAQLDGPWRPGNTPAPAPVAPLPSGPAAALGRPIAADEATSYSSNLAPLPPGEGYVSQATHAETIPLTWPEAVIIQAQAEGPPPVPPAIPGGAPPVPSYPPIDTTVDINAPASGGHPGYWSKTCDWFTKNCSFRSDHAFDEYMISPVSNPFFFEDPRALTEVRPIFIYQGAPGSNPVFAGGHSDFFGLQARVALCESWSIVMNKLGFVSLHPNDPMDGISSQTGFAEVDIGPKWTFYRNEKSGTVLATGLTFEIPTGEKAVQNTGTLGLDPYLTFAQNFGRGWLPQGVGSFNFMAETGYSFSADDQRSQYFHTSLHLDYDVVNNHHIFPLVELNWFYLTKLGDARDLTFEGGDLANFGSRDVTNRSLVTMDIGARYKFREWLQFGSAVEFPLSSNKGLTDYRLTFDVIFRY